MFRREGNSIEIKQTLFTPAAKKNEKIPFDYESEERKNQILKEFVCVHVKSEKQFIHENILSEKSVEGNESSSLVHCVAILRTILELMPSRSHSHCLIPSCALCFGIYALFYTIFDYSCRKTSYSPLSTHKSRFQLKFELFCEHKN
jgi:hypothetical protein